MSSLNDEICLVPLKDLGTWCGGGTPSKRQPAYWENGTIPWVSPKDMKVEHIRGAEDSITEKAVKESTTNLLPVGAVLAVTRSGILRHTFPVAVTEVPVTINQDLKALVPKTEVDPNYVAFALRAFSREILNQCSKQGTTVNSIETKELLRFRIPFFPYEQQKRIVAEIEKQFSRIDEAVANLKRVKVNLKRYKAAVLKAAVEGKLTEEWRKQHPDVEPADKLLERILTERRENWQGRGKYKEPSAPDTADLPDLPEGWVMARLGSLPVEVFDGPFGSNLKSSDYVSAGVRVIRLENIGSREFVDGKESFVTEEKYEQLKKHTVRHGDIIFSSFVANETRVVILPDHIKKAINKADCFCIRVSSGAVNKRYLETFLATRTAYEHLVGEIHGATRPRINTSQLKDCQVPIPPVSEQVEIVSKLSAIMSVAEVADAQVDTNLRRADRLRQSILKQAFSGQLAPQDPNDEPASVLLERMRAQPPAPAKAAKEKPAPRRLTKSIAKADPNPATPAHSSLDSILDTILRIMQPGKEYSRAEIADVLGLSSSRWNAAIQELKRRGKLRQMGERSGARYLLIR